MFLPTDAVTAYYPYFEFYSEALKRGESFLWNPYLFSGFPTYLSQSAGYLDPVNIALFSVLDPFFAYHARLALDLFLVMFFSYLAARALGLSRLAGMLVGPAYILAFNWGYLSNPVIVNSMFLMPLLVWCAVRMEEGSRRWRFACIAGAGVGWSMLSGYAQITVYAAVLFGLYLVAEQILLRRDYAWRALLNTAAVLLLAGTIGGVIALPQILPALDFSSLTVRASGLAYADTQAKVINPGDAALFIFPDNLYFPYISGGRRPLYVGALLFFLAAITAGSLAARAWRHEALSRTHKRMLVIVGLLAFCLLAAVAYSPLYYFLQQLPLLSYFRYPYRWMYVGAWMLACLGAFGLDYLHSVPQRFKILSTVLAAGVVSFAVLVGALNFLGERFWSGVGSGVHALLVQVAYGRFGLTKDPSYYADAIMRGIAAWQESLSFLNPSFACALVSLFAAAALLFLWACSRITQMQFFMGGFLLSIATFIAVFVAQWPHTLPQSAARLSHVPVTQEFSGIQEGGYRTFPFMLSESFSKSVPPQYTLSTKEEQAATELQLASGWPNTNTFVDALSADGYDQFVSTEMLAALEAAGSTHGAQDATRSLSAQEKAARLLKHLDLLGVMSVKYIVSGMPLEHQSLAFVSEVPVTRYQVPLYVYENLKALPRTYYAQKVSSQAGMSMSDLLAAKVPFGATTYLDCSSCAPLVPSIADKLVLTRKENGFFSFETDTRAGRWLVVTESALPGWVVHINGEEAPLVRANGLYMAVEVPPGKHTVVFEYKGMRGELRWLKILGLVGEK